MSYPPYATILAPSATWIWCSGVRLGLSILAHQRRQERLLHVQPVLGFVPHTRLRAFDHVCRNLLAAVGGEAMQEDGLRIGELHQVRVDRIAAERVAPRLGLLLLPHRRPHVGVHHVRALYCFFWGLRDGEIGARRLGPLEDRPVSRVTLGASKAQLESLQPCRLAS